MAKKILADQPITQTSRRILILGGTFEANQLAEKLAGNARLKVITSLAGRTETPAVITGRVRRGGFGGVSGLQAFLRGNVIDLVVDATHPFATQISLNAAAAARAAGCGYYRLCRPPWAQQVGDLWSNADDVACAATQLTTGSVVFLTIGRQQLAPFAARRDVRIIARTIGTPDIEISGGDPGDGGVQEHMTIIRARPPFRLRDERDMLVRNRIDVLVTKNSGGHAVAAKLLAARELAIPVIMIQRPLGRPAPDATTAHEMAMLVEQHMT